MVPLCIYWEFFKIGRNLISWSTCYVTRYFVLFWRFFVRHFATLSEIRNFGRHLKKFTPKSFSERQQSCVGILEGSYGPSKQRWECVKKMKTFLFPCQSTFESIKSVTPKHLDFIPICGKKEWELRGDLPCTVMPTLYRRCNELYRRSFAFKFCFFAGRAFEMD